MNIGERAAQAAAWKATGQCNCAQAVLKAFEDKLPVDADTLMKLGAGYAAGMGCMESTCGALIGAVIGGGHRHRRQGHTPHFQELLQNVSGKVRCYHLQGPEGDRERRTAVPLPGVRPQRCSGTGRGAGRVSRSYALL